MKIFRTMLVLATLTAACSAAFAVDREITLINVKYQGKVLWLPGPIICRKGETVQLTLINNVPDDPAVHGFSIPEFGVKVDAERGKPQTVKFKADKTGLFETNCHLHPAHLPGQMLVLKEK